MKTLTHTTLKKIRKRAPCEDGWERLLKHLGKTKADDEELAFVEILKSNGINDAVWCLRTLPNDCKEVRLFSCDIAEQVLHFFEDKYPKDKRPRLAIEAARKYTSGEISSNDLAAAEAAARDARDAARAAWADAEAAAEAAARDAWAAARAAWAAAMAARDVSGAAWAAVCTAAGAAKKECQDQLFIKYFGGGK